MPLRAEHRARQADPAGFTRGSFRSKELRPGLRLILGRRKGEETLSVQSVAFNAILWTPQEARRWLALHGYTADGFTQATGTTVPDLSGLRIAQLDTAREAQAVARAVRANGGNARAIQNVLFSDADMEVQP